MNDTKDFYWNHTALLCFDDETGEGGHVSNNNSNCNLTHVTEDTETALKACVVSGPIETGEIVLAFILAVVVSTTIFGNLLVIIAILKYKNLQTTFNYYVFNLAITDFAVGLSAMTFYSVDRVMGCWPFGMFMCGVWIFFDYGMTFASVFTLVAISIDRLWSISWPIHYQKHNKKSKVVIAVSTVWLLMLIIWLPPCIMDRVKWSEPYKCIWEPSNNKEFVIFVAIFGHHMPDVILGFCYVTILRKMQIRSKVKPIFSRLSPLTVSTVSQSCSANQSAYEVDLSYNQQETAPAENTLQMPNSVIETSTNYLSASNSAQERKRRKRKKPRDPEKERERREKRVFIMLTYIIAGYAVCWVPFHFVFDISAIHPEWISETAYAIFFYMTYANSTINPFLYHASNAEFRQAFAKLLKCSNSRGTISRNPVSETTNRKRRERRVGLATDAQSGIESTANAVIE